MMLAACGKTPPGIEAGRPVTLDKVSAEKWIREIEKERAETREWLRGSPRSYLAAIDRVSFGDKLSLTVGSAAGNDIRLAESGIEPHHLKITVEGDRFRVQAVDDQARFKIENEEKREAILDPSYIQVGRFSLRLSHQHFPAILVFDPQSPRFKEYKGVEYFPIDLSYRYELTLTRDPKPIVILSTRGNQRRAERAGWLDFYVGDTPCRLEATRLLEPGSGENDMSVFFRDATSGKESYPLGRYVDLKKLENGRYLLDFNLAYNPACAFSDYYNCPIPPKSNTLSVGIRAGEMDSHYH
jgi:uncharacterized protein (DUF1684 family)